jgi:hypothetical protein
VSAVLLIGVFEGLSNSRTRSDAGNREHERI